MRKDYDEPIRWDRWGFRNPAACFETLPSSRGGVSNHATETTGTGRMFRLYELAFERMLVSIEDEEALALQDGRVPNVGID